MLSHFGSKAAQHDALHDLLGDFALVSGRVLLVIWVLTIQASASNSKMSMHHGYPS